MSLMKSTYPLFCLPPGLQVLEFLAPHGKCKAPPNWWCQPPATTGVDQGVREA